MKIEPGEWEGNRIEISMRVFTKRMHLIETKVIYGGRLRTPDDGKKQRGMKCREGTVSTKSHGDYLFRKDGRNGEKMQYKDN